MSQAAEDQRRLIVDQLTRQAEPFARLPAHSTEESIRLVVEAAGIGSEDTILDVACGPGLLACAFARIAHNATGIDLTPAMIEQARARQDSEGLANLSWHIDDVTSLPFPNGSFSVAFSRYSIHHLLDPSSALAEMVRVTGPGGRVVVVDVYTSSPEQAKAYNHVERLRDPSHVRALGLGELTDLLRNAGLRDLETCRYGLEMNLERLLAASFPEPGADEEIRRLFTADLGRDLLGVGAHLVGGEIHFAFPTAILVGCKPASVGDGLRYRDGR
jgi:SAM-dependent methyltransferase